MSTTKRFILAGLLASLSFLAGLTGLQAHAGHGASAAHTGNHLADGSSPWPPPLL